MSNRYVVLLKSLMLTTRDGVIFYRAAQNEVTDPSLRCALARVATAKRELLDALHARFGALGDTTAGAAAGAFRHFYAEMLVALATRDATAVIAELDLLEEQLVHRWEDAIRSCEHAPLRVELAALLPTVERAFAEIDRLRRMRRAA